MTLITAKWSLDDYSRIVRRLDSDKAIECE